MRTWTLEKAKNGFSEVVRLALDHEPQLVTRGRSGNDAVVIIAREDYERLIAPADVYTSLQRSPLARAVAEGAFEGAEPFPRSAGFGREPDLTGASSEDDSTGVP